MTNNRPFHNNQTKPLRCQTKSMKNPPGQTAEDTIMIQAGEYSQPPEADIFILSENVA